MARLLKTSVPRYCRLDSSSSAIQSSSNRVTSSASVSDGRAASTYTHICWSDSGGKPPLQVRKSSRIAFAACVSIFPLGGADRISFIDFTSQPARSQNRYKQLIQMTWPTPSPKSSDRASWRRSSQRTQLPSCWSGGSSIPSDTVTVCTSDLSQVRPISYSHVCGRSSTSTDVSGTCTVALGAEYLRRGATTGLPRCGATPPEISGLSESCGRAAGG